MVGNDGSGRARTSERGTYWRLRAAILPEGRRRGRGRRGLAPRRPGDRGRCGPQRRLDRERAGRAPRRASGTPTRTRASRASPPTSASTPARPSRSRSRPKPTEYRIRIYRMGWYQGLGARRVAEVMPSAPLPQLQPRTPHRRRLPGPARDRARRLRQLGGVGHLAGPRRRGVGRLLRQLRAARRPWRDQPGVLRRAQRRAADRPAGADVGHDDARLQPVGRQQPLLQRDARPGLQGQLQPAVPHRRQRQRVLGRRVPAGAVARAQRLRRRLHDLRRHRPAGRRAAAPQGVRVLGPRRVLVRPPSGRTSRPPATPASTWCSWPATRSSGRSAGSRAPTRRRHQPRARSSATRRRSPGPSSTRRPSGPAPGATRGSARRPTAAGPSCR